MGFLNFIRKFLERTASPEEPAVSMSEDEDGDEALPPPVEITDELDLHGFFPEQARRMIPDFLENAVQLGLDEVKIIHGKGKGKMKATVLDILSKHSLVKAFRDAPPYSSGWGATIVHLRKPRNHP